MLAKVGERLLLLKGETLTVEQKASVGIQCVPLPWPEPELHWGCSPYKSPLQKQNLSQSRGSCSDTVSLTLPATPSDYTRSESYFSYPCALKCFEEYFWTFLEIVGSLAQRHCVLSCSNTQWKKASKAILENVSEELIHWPPGYSGQKWLL